MSIVCMGELLIDFVALENGVTVGEASGFEKAPGGAPANVAVAVSRLGHDAAFITQVGDDPFGHYLAGVLDENNVDTTGIRYTPEAQTMLAFVSLREDGERSFQFYRKPSADMLMTPDDVATEVIDEATIFHFGSITMITSPAREATLFAASHAQRNDTLISYDPNLRLVLWDDAESARVGMRRGLEYAHIVKISDEERDIVLREGETIADLFEAYEQIQLIVLTHGKDGATAHTRAGEQAQVAGYSVNSVDTTGAGDAFVAGMLVNLTEQMNGGADWESIDYAALLRFANATGALAITGRGAIPSLPSRDEAESFIAENRR